jgi:5-histidylcysteine sulfoxide synthase/putative 4-mercaptohistidine N1-methyltranferase
MTVLDKVATSSEHASRDSRNQRSPQQQVTEKPMYSLPLLNLDGGRAAVLAYFENTWALTEQLFSSLASEEAFLTRPYHKTRHPLIFYYAHPVCFYVNKLLVSGLLEAPVNQTLELLFETGVDEMNWDDLHDGEQDVWPSLDEVREYRSQVYKLVKGVIQTHPDLDEPITMDKPTWALAMAFEHERIHLETSSVLMRELPVALVKEPKAWPPYLTAPVAAVSDPVSGRDYPNNELVEIAGGEAKLGKPRSWPSFGWDNEYGHDKRQVTDFRTSKFLISNGEFFEFVKSGGYEEKKHWSDSGWGWRQFRNVKWPTFWVQDGPAGSNKFKLRSTFAELPMQWSWPAVVNFYEAKAYCHWLSEKEGVETPYRLLQESEHQAVRGPEIGKASDWPAGGDSLLAYDQVMNSTELYSINHNLRFGSEGAVDSFAANENGVYDAQGNVWQWCEDAFHELPDFEIHPLYTDFSTPCFDGEHQMMLGGSFISTGDEASIWARFQFRPHFFQHAGFRVTQEIAELTKKGDKYDTDAVVSQYLLFHYGSAEEQRDTAISAGVGHPTTVNLIDRTVELMQKFSPNKDNALDLGCAVGRSSFELAREFSQVVALDYSEAFIDAANEVKRDGELDYQRWDTGRFQTPLTASVDASIDRERLSFIQGDAANLEAANLFDTTAPFDAILLSNLLCRLTHPENCLRQFVDSDKYIKSGGILVIASPNTWMEQYTPPESFLDGEDSDATLAAIGLLLPGFELIHQEDIPFMIREHRRKYEYIISQGSVWKKL